MYAVFTHQGCRDAVEKHTPKREPPKMFVFCTVPVRYVALSAAAPRRDKIAKVIYECNSDGEAAAAGSGFSD